MKKFFEYNSYILSRLLPMAVLFFLFQAILRISLIVWEYSNVSLSAADSLKMVFVGFWFDIITLSFFIIPYILYLIILPKKLHFGKIDHIITKVCYIILTYLLIYDMVAEWVFWEEFHARFNFIAVDYLVYTNEVLANIWESYPIVWLLLVIGAITAAIYYFTRNFLLLPKYKKVENVLLRAAFGSLYIAVAVLFFFVSKIDQAEVSQNDYNNEITKNGIFSLFSAFRNNELDYKRFYLAKYQDKQIPSIKDLLKEEDKNAKFTSKDPEDIARFISGKGKEKHKNVIIVVMESMGAGFMKKFGNKDNLTPNLDELVNKSIFFSNSYATGNRTIRGLEAISLSTPPTPGHSIVKRPDNENLSSLGFIFKDRGYDTRFIYGGYGYFDNMNYFFQNNGFDIVDRSNFSENEQTFANAWGLCDEDLFNKVISEATISNKNGKPFMHMVMTTSNHRPYTFPKNDANIPTEGGKRNAGVRYADYAIGKFLDNAKKQSWFNDTVFVFIADHTAGSAGKVELTKEKYHIPIFIYSPSFIKPREASYITSQIDLAPTLLGILDFSYYSKFYGKNVLDDNKKIPRAFIANYQKLGYIEGNNLTILKPGKAFSQYNGSDFSTEIDEKLLIKTISYYSHAYNWKENLKRINTVTGKKY